MDSNSTRDVVVTGGGRQVAADSGLFVLGRFCDGLGLGKALSARCRAVVSARLRMIVAR